MKSTRTNTILALVPAVIRITILNPKYLLWRPLTSENINHEMTSFRMQMGSRAEARGRTQKNHQAGPQSHVLIVEKSATYLTIVQKKFLGYFVFGAERMIILRLPVPHCSHCMPSKNGAAALLDHEQAECKPNEEM